MIELVPCAEEHEWLIHGWRNMPDVRNFMYTTEVIDPQTHTRWYADLLSSDDRVGWVIQMDGQPVGAAFVSGIDRVNRRASWAFYLADPSTRGKGVGGAVEFSVIEYCFNDLGLRKLCCEVMSFNAAVIAMHKKFGFVEEGVLRDHWVRDGSLVDTHLLALFADAWEAKREQHASTLRERGLLA